MITAVAAYVISTSDDEPRLALSVAPGAFTESGTLDESIFRASFSPDGQRILAFGRDGIGIARGGEMELVTEPGSRATDAAWMPDSKSVLVAEGPGEITRLAVLDLDGAVTGVANLSTPFSVGAGNGMAVDSRGARAVVSTEMRDTIGGRRRLDLVLVDLPTGHVTSLTTTPDANESAPVFLDDNRIAFTRASDEQAVIELDLRSSEERELVQGERARAVGVLTGGAVVLAATQGDRMVIRSAGARLAVQPKDVIVWTVDPTASLAVVTGWTTTEAGQRVPRLRAITLTPPEPG